MAKTYKNSLEFRCKRGEHADDIKDMSLDIEWLMNTTYSICDTKKKYNLMHLQQIHSDYMMFDVKHPMYNPKDFKITAPYMYKIIEDFNCVLEKLIYKKSK